MILLHLDRANGLIQRSSHWMKTENDLLSMLKIDLKIAMICEELEEQMSFF